jgi:hypothetical protein
MRAMIALALLLIAGQAGADQAEQVISVQQDSVRSVTCWILNDSAISCLPDSQLQRQQASTAADETAIPASTPTARGHERFQL